jgi:hypothetical protein
MGRCRLRAWGSVCIVALSLLAWRTSSMAISLDSEGDIKLGMRTYVNARVGTQDTNNGIPVVSPDGLTKTSTSATWPSSAAGHLRQNRLFIEIEMNHDLDRLVKEGVGPFSLLNDLPFKVKGLAYHFTFRGEGDGLYDWGPKEYSTAGPFQTLRLADIPNALVNKNPQAFEQVASRRQHLRQLGTDRERLFQAYVEGNVGNLFVRVGRQILSWGETDAFQLLDRINPVDSSFGGFLVPLDERRVPLDMAIANYYLGDYGPFSEVHLEGYVAIDNKVGFFPGTPAGSPWTLPSLGAPSNDSRDFLNRPARTINNARGGAQLKFNVLDATFGLAHYYTYFDTESLKAVTNTNMLHAFDDGLPCPVNQFDSMQGEDPGNPHCGAVAHVYHTAPKVQVSGASTTFALPQIYSVFRSEVAYFKDEPAFTQGQLDPFYFNDPLAGVYRSYKFPDGRRFLPASQTTGGRRLRDSFNAVVGLDTNQWFRFLNPNQTFFISTQFFYKHILNAAGSNLYTTVIDKSGKAIQVLNPDREVLPITGALADYGTVSPIKNIEPVYIQQPSNQYLQTLFIGTSYRSGTINPSLTMFYDWGGAFVYQPAIQFSRDPFRFAIDYSIIDAHSYKGGSGVSLLKDRDNVQFRFEYVI